MTEYIHSSTDLRHLPSQPVYVILPLIELLRQHLCQHPVGFMLETSVRKLATAIGRKNAGGITPLLKQLEDDGWIARDADVNGTVIEVRRTDQPFDRIPAPAAPAVLMDATPTPTEPTPPVQLADRFAEREAGDQPTAQPACMDDHDLNQDKHKQQQLAALTRNFSDEQHALFAFILGQDSTIFPGYAAKIVRNRVGNRDDFAVDLGRANLRRSTERAVRLVESVWASGQRLTWNEEQHDNATKRGAARGGTFAGRTERPAGRAESGGRTTTTQPPPLQRGALASYPKRGAVAVQAVSG